MLSWGTVCDPSNGRLNFIVVNGIHNITAILIC